MLVGLLLSSVACGEGASIPAAPAPFAETPRLLLITVDTLRADHVGVYGGPVPTPAIDWLAHSGVWLEGACTPTPTTGPAHASLLTGLHPWRHGVLDNAVPLEPGPVSLAQIARDAGFSTGAFVSSYVLHRRFGLDRGFEHYHFEPGEPYFWRGKWRRAFWTRGAATTDAALVWIAAQRERSFVAWVHYFDPHSPYAPPAGFERPPTEPVPVARKTLPRGIGSFARLADEIRAYRGEVAYVDAQIGQLLEGVRALGLLDETAVILTSDHGEGLGDHGVLEHGQHLYDELVRVPLIVRAPGLPAGRRLAGPAQLEDLMPTALALLGLPVPDALDGHDLGPWLRGGAERSPRAAVLGRRKAYQGRPALFYQRRHPDKWIGSPDGRGVRFSLDADPREAEGELEPDPPEPLREVVATAGAAPDRPPVLDDETRRALEALGYLEER